MGGYFYVRFQFEYRMILEHLVLDKDNEDHYNKYLTMTEEKTQKERVEVYHRHRPI
jgi:outer membrane protease